VLNLRVCAMRHARALQPGDCHLAAPPALRPLTPEGEGEQSLRVSRAFLGWFPSSPPFFLPSFLPSLFLPIIFLYGKHLCRKTLTTAKWRKRPCRLEGVHGTAQAAFPHTPSAVPESSTGELSLTPMMKAGAKGTHLPPPAGAHALTPPPPPHRISRSGAERASLR
jgi:hypothetical protein